MDYSERIRVYLCQELARLDKEQAWLQETIAILQRRYYESEKEAQSRAESLLRLEEASALFKEISQSAIPDEIPLGSAFFVND